jgi:hypothetical protein
MDTLRIRCTRLAKCTAKFIMLNQRLVPLVAAQADPGVSSDTAHGFMIHAGSTGSCIHLYKCNPRVLESTKDVEDPIAGKKT